jgi:hypothetical protein
MATETKPYKRPSSNLHAGLSPEEKDEIYFERCKRFTQKQEDFIRDKWEDKDMSMVQLARLVSKIGAVDGVRVDPHHLRAYGRTVGLGNRPYAITHKIKPNRFGMRA